MQAILFNFSKRLNSTKRPVDAEGTEITVSIKQNVPKGQSSAQSGTETFLSHPTLWVQGDYSDYNYMKFKGRYYFIRDIQLTINNATVIYGEIDALASYKNEITASSQFVMYDETENKWIPDKRLAMFTAHTAQGSEPAPSLPYYNPNGTYLVTVNGEGMISTFAVTNGDLAMLTDGFDSWIRNQGWNTDELFEQYIASGSIAENIKNCIWIPFDLDVQLSPTPLQIKLGTWDSGVYGKRINGRVQDNHNNPLTLNIPWQFEDWRNAEPYTHLYCYIPFIGMVQIPTTELLQCTTMKVYVALDVLTGEMVVKLTALGASGYEISIGSYGANVGAQYFIGSSNISGRQLVNGITSGVSNFLQGEGRMMMGAVSIAGGNVPAGVAQIGAGFGAFGQAATNFTDAFTPINTVVGGLSSAAASGLPSTIKLFTLTHNVAGTPTGASVFFGTPTMRYKSLSGLSGYVQCQNASVNVACIETVRDLINESLNRGIYIE